MEKLPEAKGFDRFGLFVQDYGGPVGFRIVSSRPEAFEWLIVQNSHCYDEGFTVLGMVFVGHSGRIVRPKPKSR